MPGPQRGYAGASHIPRTASCKRRCQGPGGIHGLLRKGFPRGAIENRAIVRDGVYRGMLESLAQGRRQKSEGPQGIQGRSQAEAGS